MKNIYIVEHRDWDIDTKYFISESKEKCEEFIKNTQNISSSEMIICEYELNVERW